MAAVAAAAPVPAGHPAAQVAAAQAAAAVLPDVVAPREDRRGAAGPAADWAAAAAANRVRETASARASSAAAASASTRATTSSTAELAGTRAAAFSRTARPEPARGGHGRARSWARYAAPARYVAERSAAPACNCADLHGDARSDGHRLLRARQRDMPHRLRGCVCASPTTPVATPVGDRPIADLEVGDLVYSIDHSSLAVVPIKRVHRQPVTGKPPRRRAEARPRRDAERSVPAIRRRTAAILPTSAPAMSSTASACSAPGSSTTICRSPTTYSPTRTWALTSRAEP